MRNDRGRSLEISRVLLAFSTEACFKPVAAVGVACLRTCALYDICYKFLSRLDSALRVRCVSAVCVTCVHFFELMRPVRCTVSRPAGSRHCLRPSISSIYFNCVQVSPHCA